MNVSTLKNCNLFKLYKYTHCVIHFHCHDLTLFSCNLFEKRKMWHKIVDCWSCQETPPRKPGIHSTFKLGSCCSFFCHCCFFSFLSSLSLLSPLLASLYHPLERERSMCIGKRVWRLINYLWQLKKRHDAMSCSRFTRWGESETWIITRGEERAGLRRERGRENCVCVSECVCERLHFLSLSLCVRDWRCCWLARHLVEGREEKTVEHEQWEVCERRERNRRRRRRRREKKSDM